MPHEAGLPHWLPYWLSRLLLSGVPLGMAAEHPLFELPKEDDDRDWVEQGRILRTPTGYIPIKRGNSVEDVSVTTQPLLRSKLLAMAENPPVAGEPLQVGPWGLPMRPPATPLGVRIGKQAPLPPSPKDPDGDKDPEEDRWIEVIPEKLEQNLTTGEYRSYESGLPMRLDSAKVLLSQFFGEDQQGQSPADKATILRLQQQLAQQQPSVDRGQIWEDIRRDILASLTTPADWIKRWQLMNAPNPWAPSEQDALVRELEGLEAQREQEKLKNIEHKETFGGHPGPSSELPQEIRQIEGEIEALDIANQQRQLTPPAPAWLPEFVLGQIAGEPIQRARVQTPSGQQWAGADWSVREGLRGFTEFAGFRPYRDILEQMARTQPRTARVASRWGPVRQR